MSAFSAANYQMSYRKGELWHSPSSTCNTNKFLIYKLLSEKKMIIKTCQQDLIRAWFLAKESPISRRTYYNITANHDCMEFKFAPKLHHCHYQYHQYHYYPQERIHLHCFLPKVTACYSLVPSASYHHLPKVTLRTILDKKT